MDASGEADADNSSSTRWNEENRRLRDEIEENQRVDKEKLLALRDIFLTNFSGWYREILMGAELEFCPFTASAAVNGRYHDTEQAWKSGSFPFADDDDQWLKIVREIWPRVDDEGDIKCVDTKADTRVSVWEFTHAENGRLRHLPPSDRLPTAVASPSEVVSAASREPWARDGTLHLWNMNFVFMPKMVLSLTQFSNPQH